MSRDNNLTVTQPILDEIAEQDNAISSYLEGKTFNRTQIIDETKYWLRQHVVTLFEVGRRLMALKQRSEHGEFTKLVEEEFHMTPRYAAQLMSAAKTAIELNKLSSGKIGLEKFDKIDKQKIVLIGSIIDDFKDEIEELGTIGGRTIDEYDAMSRKELAALVKKQREQIDQGIEKVKDLKEQVYAEKEKREAMLEQSENTVTESCARFLRDIRSAVDTFDRTCHSGIDELSPATRLQILSTRTEARNLYEQIDRIIKERFEDVLEEEVPDDLGLADGIVIDAHEN